MDSLIVNDEILTTWTLFRIVSITVGLTFAYAAVAKVGGLSALTAGIREFNLMPGQLAGVVAAMLILAESAIALSHIGGIAMKVMVPATLLLLCVFLVGTADILRRGLARPCLCFGTNRGDQIDIYSLVRIGLLLLAESMLYLYQLSGGVMQALASGRPYDELLFMILVSAILAAIIGWCLAVPKFWRARKVLDI